MRFSIVLFLLINGFVFYSQNSGNSLDIDEKDFELYKNFLPDIEINASNAEYVRKWNRTKFYVKSVYDYSVISSAMLSAFEDTLSTISKQRNKNNLR